MKSRYLFLLLMIVSVCANAQNTFPATGKAGIGTQTPSELLTLQGGEVLVRSAQNTNDAVHLGIKFSTDNEPYYTAIRAHRGTTSTRTGLSFFVSNAVLPAEVMRINWNGNVGIGTSAPQSKLAVNGDIFAKKVKVIQTGWPDYVFQQDYKLPSLQELRQYIAEHQHLPGIPSAKDVADDGLDLGEMNKILLQKVEELTLYLIAEHEDKELLKKEIKTLKTLLDNKGLNR